MRIKLLLLSLGIAFSGGLARADCVSYIDPPELHCVGSNGCDSFVPRTGCTIGCISGTCNPRSNVANCCGTVQRYAQIFIDGGTCISDCGLARIKRAQTRPRKLDEIVESKSRAPLMHLPPRRLFIPSTCTHE